jgi:hypothetical protein
LPPGGELAREVARQAARIQTLEAQVSVLQAARRADGVLEAQIARLEAHGPGPPGAIKRPQRFPMKIQSVWGFCMGAQGA